jgi:cell division topological specificity factor
MNMLNLFKRRKSAPVARERLQVLLAHERASLGRSDLIARLREDIVAAIGRHIPITAGQVTVKMNRRHAVSTLKIDIDLPAVPEPA